MLRLSVYFLLLFHFPVFGQILPFKNYSSKPELMDQQITGLIKDDRGLLWIGTPFGLYWFTGSQFYEPEIEAKTGQLYINNFYKDLGGTIWVLTFYNGIYQYSNGKFINYLPLSENISSVRNTVFNMLQFDSNNYIVSTDGALLWFDKKKFRPFDTQQKLYEKNISSIVKIDNENVLLGTEKGIILCNIVQNKLVGSDILLGEYGISQITVRANQIWVGTNKGLFLYKDLAGLKANNYEQYYLHGKAITTMAISKEDELWVGADKAYKIIQGNVITYDLNNGLTAIPMYIYSDPAGITWFVSKKGISSLSNEYFKIYDLTNNSFNAMTIAIGTDMQNNLWFGSYDGVVKKTKNGYQLFASINSQKIGYTSWMLKTKNNELITGTDAGVLKLDEKPSRLSTLKTSRAFEDNQGRIWLGTDKGELYLFDKDVLRKIDIPLDLKDYIDAIQIDPRGDLWIGYRSNGIVKFGLRGLQLIFINRYSAKEGFPDIRIRSSAIDKKGNVIFGTRTNGLFIFSTKDDKHWHINSSKGLSANWIKTISVDDKNNIYLATNKGVNILQNGNYDAPRIRIPVLTNQGKGKSTNVLVINNDTIRVGTDEAIIEYSPQKDLPDTTHPPIYFTKISINGKADTRFTPYTTPTSSLKLPYDSSIVAFEFAGVDLKNEGIRYSYFLKGQDVDWSEPSERNFVSYHLPSGAFEFSVKAISKDGLPSLNPATISFIVKAPFWKQIWFILVCITLVVGLIYFIYQYRIAHLMKLQKLRSRISSDLHDDIGSTLSSISILSEVAIHEEDAKHTKDMVKEIKDNSILLMEKMDDIIWSINPQMDTVEDLLIRIKRFSSTLFEAKDINYNIDIHDSVRNVTLSMENRQHMYLIVKEAINNLIKHSSCTSAEIKIDCHAGFLQIVIRDNGKGFDMTKASSGNGLMNMKSRAQEMKADFKIESSKGKGTRILVQSKIK